MIVNVKNQSTWSARPVRAASPCTRRVDVPVEPAREDYLLSGGASLSIAGGISYGLGAATGYPWLTVAGVLASAVGAGVSGVAIYRMQGGRHGASAIGSAAMLGAAAHSVGFIVGRAVAHLAVGA
ncbi:MAG: hypothetical protein AB1758_33700 [Candidatus Eremiobacterota bacterium]